MIALLLLLAAPAQTAAQGETANLRQITIELPPHATEADKAERRQSLETAMQGNACGRVDAVASPTGGILLSKDDFPLSRMPSRLARQLAAKPAGTATDIFGEDGPDRTVYSILIRC